MKLTVNLEHHPYDILIEKGSISAVGAWVSEIWSARKVVLITDNRVNAFYGRKVMESLKNAGFEVHLFTFLEGEASKNLVTAERAWNFCAESGLTRTDGIIALGGGVVGDLAGFVASTYMRGIPFLQVPTSLTAQVDSSIGGKTAINTSFAKNMIGTFAQPDGVLIDPEVLESLGQREFREGMGEVVKCAFIADKKLYDLLFELEEKDLMDHIEEIIYHSCEVKRKVVVDDELDRGVRLYLNFGHTIGHAIEQTSGYGKIMHGEAVSIGMVQLSKIAEKKELIKQGLTEKIRQILEKFALPVEIQEWNQERLFQALAHDKKVAGRTIKTVLVPEIGKAIINEISLEDFKEYLEK